MHRLLLAFLTTLCAIGPALGQEGKGRISGRVVHEGEGVVAVVVVIQELKAVEITDKEGRFLFKNVPAGRYTLTFTLGDKSVVRENVFVAEGRTHELEQEVDWQPGLAEEVRVTAGAAQAAKIVDAPAAVTAITAKEVEREAAHGQVPKILEFTPGAEVTQSGLYDFNFNTRGFNSSLNRRVSTYIDGRDVGVVLLGAQEWAAISGGLDDVASLEFIRGPSAALYGANASSGVINITTKAPRESLGTLVRLTGGELDTRSLDFRRADKLGERWFSKITAGVKGSGDFSISRDPDGPDRMARTADDLEAPEYAEFCPPPGSREQGTDCLLAEKPLFVEQDNDIRYGSLRLDTYLGKESSLTFETGFSNIEGPVIQTGIGRVQVIDARRQFYRFNYSNAHWNVLGHFAEREGDQANLTKSLRFNYALSSDTKRYGVEAQGHWDFFGDRGRLVVGAAHTEEEVDTTCTDIGDDPLRPRCSAGDQTVVFEPIETDRQAIFSQFDWRVNDHVKLVFAGRVDENTLHDTQFSPKAALVYSITPKNSLRFTYNRAFQVANYSEFFLNTGVFLFPVSGFIRFWCQSPILPPGGIDCGIPPFDENGQETFIPIVAVGNDDLQLEKTEAWEVGYSGLFANRVFLTVDYYNSKNKDFITDLVPQLGTVLGSCQPDEPIQDPTVCPINNDYPRWVFSEAAETTFLRQPIPPGFPGLTVAQALRNSIEQVVPGARLSRNLDGSPVIVARTYTNIGEVDTQGVDFGIQYFINDAWNVQASYSWFDFEIVDADPSVEDILLPNSPEKKASLAVSFNRKRWAATVAGRWVEGFRWSAGVFQGPVEEYETIDFTGSYTIADWMRAGVNVANVRDNIHRQTFGGDLLYRRALVNLSFLF